jgi:hypothetical protein
MSRDVTMEVKSHREVDARSRDITREVHAMSRDDSLFTQSSLVSSTWALAQRHSRHQS